MENENTVIDDLPENENNSTINSTEGAEGRISEDTPNYADDLKRQSDLIDKLIAQNESLANQISTLIRNGVAINDGKKTPDEPIQNQTSIDDFRDEFIPLEELGRMMYKKE